MDLVNSVTQNSNNRNTTMENQASNEQQNKSVMLEEKNFEAAPKNQIPEYLRVIGMDPRKFWPKKYRFTREKSPGAYNPLTIAQRNFYETNGYIILDDCVSKRLLDQIQSSKKQQQQQQQLHFNSKRDESDFVDEFLLDKLLVKNGRLNQYIKCFCDEKFMLMTHRLVEQFITYDKVAKDWEDNERKGLNINEASIESQLLAGYNRQALFRDWIYLPFRPIDKVVSTIVALEPIDHVILVVPGTHRVGQCTISSTLDNISAAYDSSEEKGHSLISREIYESSPEKLSTLVNKSRKGFKYINLKPGQTLFYHPGLVHGFSSDLVNLSKRQLAVLAYYAAADCEFVDLKQSLSFGDTQMIQKQEHSEQVPINLAHFGDKNPRDYRSWLDKPRLVSETKANL